jgi:hypothetical protein
MIKMKVKVNLCSKGLFLQSIQIEEISNYQMKFKSQVCKIKFCGIGQYQMIISSKYVLFCNAKKSISQSPNLDLSNECMHSYGKLRQGQTSATGTNN